MHDFIWTELATLLAVLLFLITGFRVASARHKYKVTPPATTGDPMFERHFRVQANTLEWLAIFLPSLWIFAFYWGDQIAAGLGAVWIVGRLFYMIGYVSEPKARGIGFLIQMLAALALLIGAIIGVVQKLIG